MRRLAAAAGITLLLGSCGEPVIPHAVSQTNDAHCVTCHATGANGAKVSPHPDRRDCVGCHRPEGTLDVGAQHWPGPND
ncbi:MAG: hypothetical protein OEM94_00215 [Acidimicrobiia bacterium]|nr:hypothetical protein [Acidimicrobiia bacterium]